MEAEPGLPVVTISPAVVDVTHADAIVRLSSNGLPNFNYFSLSSQTGPPMEMTVDWDRTGQISQDVLIPKGTPPGRWNLGVRHENWWGFGAPVSGPVRHTLPLGFPSGIEILNNGPVDQEPPQVSELVIDPAVVDVTTGPALARLRFRLQDQEFFSGMK